MNIRATYNGHFPQKWGTERWTAIDDDTYDGPGSPIGWGATEAEAITDLMEQLADRDDRDRYEYETGGKP